MQQAKALWECCVKGGEAPAAGEDTGNGWGDKGQGMERWQHQHGVAAGCVKGQGMERWQHQYGVAAGCVKD